MILRGLLGASLATLLLTAPALAQSPATTPDKTAPTPANPATATAKPASPAPAQAATKKTDPAKKAATKKADPKKAADSAKKTAAPVKTAAEAAKPAARDKVAATSKPPVPSYTITTTTRDHATYTTTRIVPLSPTPASSARKVETIAAPADMAAAPTKPAATARPAAPIAAVPLPLAPQARTVTAAAAAPSPAKPAATARPAAQIAMLPLPPAPKARMATAAAAPSSAKPAAPPTPTANAAVVPVSLEARTESARPQPARPQPTRPTAPSSATATPYAQPSPTGPADPVAAASFVDTFLRDAFRVAKAGGTTSLQRRAQLAALFSRKLDISRIAGYTTADELAAMPPDIQQRFRAILISYLVETYYPRIEMASDPSVTVEITPLTTLADGSAVVTASFTKAGWETQSVKWDLMAERDGYKIIDIFSAGASLVQMERDTFLSVMRNGGVPELMAKLDARTKALASAATE